MTRSIPCAPAPADSFAPMSTLGHGVHPATRQPVTANGRLVLSIRLKFRGVPVVCHATDDELLVAFTKWRHVSKFDWQHYPAYVHA
jgi:hypothetical protein